MRLGPLWLLWLLAPFQSPFTSSWEKRWQRKLIADVLLSSRHILCISLFYSILTAMILWEASIITSLILLKWQICIIFCSSLFSLRCVIPHLWLNIYFAHAAIRIKILNDPALCHVWSIVPLILCRPESWWTASALGDHSSLWVCVWMFL